MDSGLLKLEPRTQSAVLGYPIPKRHRFDGDVLDGHESGIKNHPFAHRKLARLIKFAQT